MFENRAKNKEVLCTDKEPPSENNDMSTVNIEVEQINKSSNLRWFDKPAL